MSASVRPLDAVTGAKPKRALTLLRGGGERAPLVRGECEHAERPCPWSSCRYHLEHVEASCALDVAELGEHTLDEVGKYFGVTRERIRQIEGKALRKLEKKGFSLAVFLECEPGMRRGDGDL